MNIISPLRSAMIALLLISSSLVGHAQTANNPFIAQSGFWVVETPQKRQSCTVRFYTNDNTLIYQETIDRHLNITRQHVKHQLNAALEQALFVWQVTHQVPAERQWVAVQFDKK